MKIVGYFHLFFPEHCAGSETTVHAALSAMVRRGHEVQVICDRSVDAPYVHNGIEVVRPPRRDQQRWLQNFVADADLLVTHLDLTSLAMNLALTAKKPLVHFVHNGDQLVFWRVIPLKAQLVVFNSHWIANTPKDWTYRNSEPTLWPGPSIVVHPVVEPERYRCERGNAVTLVNPTATKGSATFYELAQRFSERDFITAQGGYNYQVSCPSKDSPRVTQPIERRNHSFYDDKGVEQNCFGLPNVTHYQRDPDIRNIFRRTRILLMPSDYESYGRVGVEAACAGIPTIAHPTPGLKEAFGDAAIFCDRNDVDAWEKEIDRLYTDEAYYQQRSNAALVLADSLRPEAEFDRLEQALIETADRWREEHEAKEMNIWISDRKIWKTKHGYRVEVDGRIPADAVTLYAGIGTRVPMDLAVEQGWVGNHTRTIEVGKMEDGPQENKMIAAPKETKGKRVAA